MTRDPFIVYTSNLWAILSLRGLYGFVSTFMQQMRYLDKAGEQECTAQQAGAAAHMPCAVQLQGCRHGMWPALQLGRSW